MKNSIQLIIILLTINISSFAQTVEGIVYDEDNQTLPGVEIRIKGTTIGTMCDFNGKFSLKLPDNSGHKLTFQMLSCEFETENIYDSSFIEATIELKKVFGRKYKCISHSYKIKNTNKPFGQKITLNVSGLKKNKNSEASINNKKKEQNSSYWNNPRDYHTSRLKKEEYKSFYQKGAGGTIITSDFNHIICNYIGKWGIIIDTTCYDIISKAPYIFDYKIGTRSTNNDYQYIDILNKMRINIQSVEKKYIFIFFDCINNIRYPKIEIKNPNSSFSYNFINYKANNFLIKETINNETNYVLYNTTLKSNGKIKIKKSIVNKTLPSSIKIFNIYYAINDTIYYKNLTLKYNKEKHALKEIQSCSSKNDYYRFTNMFSDGDLFNFVSQKIDSLNYIQVEKMNDNKAYAKFIQQYPTSKYISKAKQNKKQLENKQAYDLEKSYYEKSKAGNINDCDNYFSKYPNGNFTQKVKTRKRKLLDDKELAVYEIAKYGDKDDCNSYLSEYPSGKYVSQVKERKLYLEIKYANKASDFDKYLIKYPSGEYYSDIKDRKKNLNAKLERKRKIKANSDIRKWDLGLKICRQDYRGIVMGSIEQWNSSKSRVQIKIAASPGGLNSDNEKLTKGNKIWIIPSDGWHLCLQDEKEYAIAHDKSDDFEKYVAQSSSSSNTKKGKFDMGTSVSYTFKTSTLGLWTNDYYVKGVVNGWNADFSKMKIKISTTNYDDPGDDRLFNGQTFYRGNEIWVSPYKWK